MSNPAMDILAAAMQTANKANAVADEGSFTACSAATEPSEGFKLKKPLDGITLRGYQMAVVEAIEQFNAVIVGLEPGLGKTITALASGSQLGGSTLIVCPPSILHTVWENEIKSVYPDATYTIVKGTKRKPIDKADFVIIGDAVLYARVEDLAAIDFSLIVFDECHRYKTPSAQRTKAAIALTDHSRKSGVKVMPMTGTLSTNHPAEVFGPMRIANIAKAVNGTNRYADHERLWCETTIFNVKTTRFQNGRERQVTIPVKQIIGAKNPEGLNRRLRANGYYRIERDDVLDMPDKLSIVRTVYPSAADMKDYMEIQKDFLKWVEETSGKNARIRASRAEKLIKLGALTQAAGIAKSSFAVDYVSDMVESGEQVVVMAHNKSVIQHLKEQFAKNDIKAVTYTGDDSDKVKTASYDAFKSGKAKVFIGNIKAAGTGLNLENSANLVFLQLPQSAGDYIQASDRVYRMTQKRVCTIHNLLLSNNSVDHKVWLALQRKLEDTNAVNAGSAIDIDDLDLEDLL